MEKGLLAAAALLSLAWLAAAQGPTALTTDCPATTQLLYANFSVAFYKNGSLSCDNVSAYVTDSNGNLSAVPELSCASGVHLFQAYTPVTGLYAVVASGNGVNVSCSISRLPGARPAYQFPELPAALAFLAAGGALMALRRGGAKLHWKRI